MRYSRVSRISSPKEIASSVADESWMRRRVINLINDRFARPDEDTRALADNAYETDDVTCRDVLLVHRRPRGRRQPWAHGHAMRTRSRVEGIARCRARDKSKRGGSMQKWMNVARSVGDQWFSSCNVSLLDTRDEGPSAKYGQRIFRRSSFIRRMNIRSIMRDCNDWNNAFAQKYKNLSFLTVASNRSEFRNFILFT